MHRGHLHELVELISNLSQLLQINIFVFDLKGVKFPGGCDGNDVFPELSATVSKPKNFVSPRNKPLRESVVNAASFSGPNQPFFD